MKKGFTVTCEECGAIQRLDEVKGIKILLLVDRHYDENYINFECDCGNKKKY